MKTSKKLIQTVCLFVLSMFPIGALAQPLVSETDFTVAGGEDDYYHSVDMIDGFGNSTFVPQMVAGSVALADGTEATKTKSDFMDEPHYAITPNPIRLDSLRLADNEDNGEWGLVVSAGKGTKKIGQGAKVLSYTVSGLKNGGKYKVVVEYCNPLAAAYMETSGSAPAPHLTAGYQSMIRVGVNNASTSTGAQMTALPSKSLGCLSGTINSPTPTEDRQEVRPITGNKLTVNIFIGQMGEGEALMIKSIKVYAEVEPLVIGVETVCIGGETAVLSVDNTYLDATIQWQRGGSPIAGETGTTFTHTSMKDLPSDGSKSKSYVYSYVVTTKNGDKFESQPFTVTDKVCCVENNKPVSRKLIWQDDFGTFTSAKNYWTWDYSDLSDPKKIQHSDGTKWTTCSDVDITGATCGTAPSKEGVYTVAANVTSANDGTTTDGTQWNWESKFGNGLEPKANGWTFVPDHTYGTSAYGGMLFLNCNNGEDETIYKRVIKGLCQKDLTLMCYVNTFSDGANDVDIYIQAKDLSSGKVYKSDRITKSSTGSKNWVPVSIDVSLSGTELEFSIVSFAGGTTTNLSGNDLVLDDIQIYACSAPAIDLYFDLDSYSTEEKTCLGSDLGLYALETEMIKTNLQGKANYVFQYSLTPDDSKSWITLLGPVPDTKYLDLSSIIENENLKSGDRVAFRCLLGEKESLENEINTYGYYRPNAPCGEFSVSDSIIMIVDCPECTEPSDPVITAVGGTVNKAEKTVHLCKGDATTLSSSSITAVDKNGDPYSDYTISWHKNSASSTAIDKVSPAVKGNDISVTWDDVQAAGTTGVKYILKFHDIFEDTNTPITDVCDKTDVITIYGDPVPETEDITLTPFCENDPNRSTMLDVALAAIPSAYDITWYTDTVTPVKGTEPDVATAAASTTPYVSYFTITDKVTKCVSKYYTFTFTVKEVPSEILAQIDPFCEYVNGAISSSADATVAPSLPASTKGYDVEWYKATPVSPANAAETDLSTLTGSTTPYTYYYTLSLDGCTSNPEEYEFTVRPLVKQLNLTKNNECDKTTLTVLTEPSDAVSTWNNGTEGKSVIFTTESEAVGTYSVTSKKDGYCESESESILSDFYKTPDALGDYTVQYLKSDGKATNGVFPTDKLLAGVAGKAATNATIKWIGQLDSSTPPSDTNGATDTPANPKADDVNDSKDEIHYYFVYQQIAYSAAVSCPSKLSTVEVKILGAPAPDVTPVSYCLNDTPDAITNFATTTTGGATDTKTYSLVWFASEADYPANPLSAAPTISTANVGVVSYYVAQWDDADHNNISSLQHVDVTTYGVLAPTAPTPINYCLNDNATQLSAVATTDVNPYWVSNGFLWEYDGTSSTSAPTPSTAAVGSKTYDVRSTYTTTTLNCVSDPFTVTVTVSETEAPSPQTIQYIKADATDGQTFPAITEAKKPWVEETGYTYFYSSVTENANVVVASGYTNAIPTPLYNTASLGGGSKELYYYVYRVDNSNPVSCPSDTVKITVKISDALSPEVKDVYVCEGSAVPDLEASVSILEGSGKTESEYSLLWYGTEDPSTSNNPTPKNTVSQTTFSTGITSAVAVNNAKTTTQYYVTQKDNTTGAESAPSVINVIVLPKPVIAPKSVPAQCEGSIDLDNWFDISNASEVGTTSATYKEGSNIVESTGIYAFTVAYPVTYTRPDYIVDDAQCVSDESSISVVIDKLDSVWIEGETTVCPGGDVELVAHISSSTHDENQTTYQWKDDRGGSAPWMSWTNNYPMTYASEADKIYNYTVTATAGTCVKTSEVHTVKVGDGPVRGTMTLTETDNTWEPSSFQNDTEREFYSCGGNLTISVDYEITDNTFSYQWYEVGSSTMLAQGPSLTIPETDASSIKTYEVRFVNKCDAKAQVTVHTIPLTVDPEVGKDTLCEGKSFNTNLTIKCDENPTIQWYLNTNPIPGANAKTYTKSSVLESEDDGQYSYEVTNRGCTRKGDAKYLDVQRYIKVVDFTEPFIVKKNTDQTIQLMIEVPETTLGVQLSDINWNEGGVSKQSGSSSKYTETGVVSDHTYEITLDDDDYCPTSTTATIWVEADLQLKTNLKDTICLGSSAILTIDTTGTGAFRKENQGIHPSLTVLRYTKGSKEYISQNLFKKNGDLIEIEVSPDDSASYTVEFTYDDQKVGPLVEEVTVIQAINLTLPPVSTICEGDTIKLGVSDISPDGTTVSWSPSETILSGADTDTIVAVPTYSAGLNHQGTYTYVVTAYNKTCDESKTYNVPVKVDEALVGTLKGSDVICEGAQGKIDASSYDATTYEWKANDEFVSSSATALVRPTETTTYEVEMTRGVCKASDSYELKVTSLPVITSVDSIGIRDRQITMEPGKGTGVFYYWIDVESSKATDNVVYNLTFSKHVAFVRDENGCQTSFPFEVIAPPVIIPEFFTPNGDGVNDNWLVEVLKDVYPDSKVQIFDRFGKLMAEYLGGDSEGWDGTYKGTPMPSTDYWYVIDIEEIDRQFSGHFTLIRQ